MQAIILGDVLSTISRDRLTNWLLANKTGDDRVRAGTPSDWKVGDKTGTSSAGVSNDIAVVWPPQREPLLIAAYLAKSSAPPAHRDAVLAGVARVVIDALVGDG
jgi:beta-lactamase class A